MDAERYILAWPLFTILWWRFKAQNATFEDKLSISRALYFVKVVDAFWGYGNIPDEKLHFIHAIGKRDKE